LTTLRLKKSEFDRDEKGPGCGLDHKTPYNAKVKENVKPHRYSPSGTSWLVIGYNLPLRKKSGL
jgi:hypothetical protein